MSEMMQFLNNCIFSRSAKTVVTCEGNYSIYWLLTFLVTCMPNILKIRQCFLELQLKMSEVLFWKQS